MNKNYQQQNFIKCDNDICKQIMYVKILCPHIFQKNTGITYDVEITQCNIVNGASLTLIIIPPIQSKLVRLIIFKQTLNLNQRANYYWCLNSCTNKIE